MIKVFKNRLVYILALMICINLIIDIQDGVLDTPVILAHSLSHVNLQLIFPDAIFRNTCEIYFSIINIYLLDYSATLILVYISLILALNNQVFIVLKYFACRLRTRPLYYKYSTIQRTVIKALLSIP
jgi:hypothetical protein